MTTGPSLGSWLAERPFHLAMSSGFFSFFAHSGVLSALEEAGLRPASVSGSSAGALAAGRWAAGLEATDLRDLYLALRKRDFWDPGPGAGLLRGRRFRSLIRAASPASRLEHCRVPAQVSTFDLARFRTRVLREGDLARALYASCAVPLMFQPIRHAGGWLVDGGVRDRPGLAGVPPGRRVLYHHIAARSPWRPRDGDVQPLPARPAMAAIVVPDLPRPGPDALEFGRDAWLAARAWTRRALDRPAGPGAR